MRDDLAPVAEERDIFFRSAGVPVVPGNSVRVLCDADENYPAWIEAIESARSTIHLEMYIVHNDRIGRRFRDMLVEKARAGVRVRVLYDWFGSLRLTSFNFWRPLTRAGGEVRVANPPRLDTFLGLVSRDHRKLLAVDGRIAYISGLCIGDDWVGDPARGVDPWRDTGVEIVGPAVADAEAVFAAAWRLWGDEPLPAGEAPQRAALPRAGDVELRVIPTSPELARVYRHDLSVASVVRERLWLTDAYFIVTPIYREALCSAADDGVDVRILLPHTSDIQWVANYSRTQYRRLLASGVRIFEWNGPMIHAKTAVADGRWTRVGSTNLNASSWIGNWELDVTIDDARIAREMEEIFLEDLENATEVVVTARNKVRLSQGLPRGARPRRRRGRARGSANRVVKDVRAVGTVLDAAVKGYRVLEPNEFSTLLGLALAVLGLAALFFYFPKSIAFPVSFLLAWLGLTLVVQSLKLRFGAKPPRIEEPPTVRDADHLPRAGDERS